MSDELSLNNQIIAIIASKDKKEMLGGGGAPIFYTKNEETQEEISMLLARITLGMVHDLGNGIKVIIKH